MYSYALHAKIRVYTLRAALLIDHCFEYRLLVYLERVRDTILNSKTINISHFNSETRLFYILFYIYFITSMIDISNIRHIVGYITWSLLSSLSNSY